MVLCKAPQEGGAENGTKGLENMADLWPIIYPITIYVVIMGNQGGNTRGNAKKHAILAAAQVVLSESTSQTNAPCLASFYGLIIGFRHSTRLFSKQSWRAFRPADQRDGGQG